MEHEQVFFPAPSGNFIDGTELYIKIDADFVERKFLDIQYAKGGDRRKLDIYLPNEGGGPYPLILDIFGGGWCFGNKSSFKMEPALNLLKRGYAVASPNYTLSSEASFPTPINEIKAAIRFLKANAHKFDIDPQRIALMGESAGAHIAALCATSAAAGALEDRALGNEEYDSRVQAVIAVYCPSDLAMWRSQFYALNIEPEFDDCDGPNSMLGAWFGHRSLKEIPQLVSTANPINYVNEKCPPFIFLHGSRDRQVPLLQSWNLAAALIAAIGKDKVEHHVIKGAEHSIYDFETEEIYSLEEAFLKKHL